MINHDDAPERPDMRLALLRRLTRLGYRVPLMRAATGRLCDRVRRHYASSGQTLLIDDFDGDLRVEVDLGDHVGSHVFFAGTYSSRELAALGRFLGEDDVVLDVGANIGVFTLYAAKRVKAGAVYAFEPVPALYAALERNIAQNGFTHVHAVQLGLSDKAAKVPIYLPAARYQDGTYNDSMASLFGQGDAWRGEAQIELTTLDAFVEERGLSRIDMIKMDIEGAELMALRGGRRALMRFRPRLLIEVNDVASRRAGYSARGLVSFLREDLGYRLYRIHTAGVLTPWSGRRLKTTQNILCQPA